MLNKILLSSLFVFTFLFCIPASFAGLSESCDPVITCHPGDDYYAGDCYLHIERVTDCGSGTDWQFNCRLGCHKKGANIPINTKSGYVPTPIINPEPEPEPEPELEPEVPSEPAPLPVPVAPPVPEKIYVDVSSLPDSCAVGQISRWNGFEWMCSDDEIGSYLDIFMFALMGGMLIVFLQFILRFFKK